MAAFTSTTPSERSQAGLGLKQLDDRELVELVAEELRLRTIHIAETCGALSFEEQLMAQWLQTYKSALK